MAKISVYYKLKKDLEDGNISLKELAKIKNRIVSFLETPGHAIYNLPRSVGVSYSFITTACIKYPEIFNLDEFKAVSNEHKNKILERVNSSIIENEKLNSSSDIIKLAMGAYENVIAEENGSQVNFSFAIPDFDKINSAAEDGPN